MADKMRRRAGFQIDGGIAQAIIWMVMSKFVRSIKHATALRETPVLPKRQITPLICSGGDDRISVQSDAHFASQEVEQDCDAFAVSHALIQAKLRVKGAVKNTNRVARNRSGRSSRTMKPCEFSLRFRLSITSQETGRGCSP